MNAIEAADFVLQRMDAEIAKVKDLMERDAHGAISDLGGSWETGRRVL